MNSTVVTKEFKDFKIEDFFDKLKSINVTRKEGKDKKIKWKPP